MTFYGRYVVRICTLVALLFGLSCSGPQAAQQDTNDDLAEAASTTETVDGEATPDAEGGDDESECLGKLTPPRGAHGRQYEQETAIADDETLEEVKQRARTDLRDRLCQGVLCSAIEQHVTIWEADQSAGFRCAMAIVPADKLRAWTERVETEIGTRIAEHAHEVVDGLRESLGGDTPRVTIAEIRDHGVPGGLRSEWLHSHLQYAVERAEAHVVPLQPNWSGHGLPDRVDGVLSAQIVPMQGVEASLEVSWEIEGKDRVFTGQAMSFPEVIAPDIDRSTYLPDLDGIADSDQVALHFDSRDGGGLCHGQQTEVWLETAQDMHVRLLNLYGTDNGLVIFPATSNSDGVVEAGQPVSIGEFEAMQHGDIGVERFLVIASPTREGLGRFASADEFCRLPSTMARDFQQGHNLPHGDDVHLFETGFRLMTDDECTGFELSQEHTQAYEQVLESAPSCW